MKLKNKRGISHLELIIAMLIFIFAVISAVLFIISATGQYKTDSNSNTLKLLENNIRKETEINFNETLLFINSSNKDCLNISFPKISQENTIILDNNLNLIAFNFSHGPGQSWLLVNNTNKGHNSVYSIYSFSEDITKDKRLGSCLGIDNLNISKDYNCSITFHDKIFSKRKFLELRSKAYSGYTNLKRMLDLGNKDFEVNIKNENGFNLNITNKTQPRQVEVKAEEFPAEIMLENGTIINAIINIKVW